MKYHLSIFITILFCFKLHSEEVDNFTLPKEVPALATGEVNRLINDHFDILVAKFNEDKNKDCNVKKLQNKVTEIFGRNFSVIALKISNTVKKIIFKTKSIKSHLLVQKIKKILFILEHLLRGVVKKVSILMKLILELIKLTISLAMVGYYGVII